MTQSIELCSTIGDLLDRQADRFGDSDALVHAATGARYT